MADPEKASGGKGRNPEIDRLESLRHEPIRLRTALESKSSEELRALHDEMPDLDVRGKASRKLLNLKKEVLATLALRSDAVAKKTLADAELPKNPEMLRQEQERYIAELSKKLASKLEAKYGYKTFDTPIEARAFVVTPIGKKVAVRIREFGKLVEVCWNAVFRNNRRDPKAASILLRPEKLPMHIEFWDKPDGFNEESFRWLLINQKVYPQTAEGAKKEIARAKKYDNWIDFKFARNGFDNIWYHDGQSYAPVFRAFGLPSKMPAHEKLIKILEVLNQQL